MKIRKVFNSKIAQWLDVRAITLYPFIFFADAEDEVEDHVHQHEMIHVAQVEQVGWFAFYLSYLFYYWAELLQGRDSEAAYYRIPYEKEAYEHEHDRK